MKKPTKRIQLRDQGVDFKASYPVEGAVDILKTKGEVGKGGVKFDQRVEVVLVTGLDSKKGDQNIRFSVQLPHGTGKSVRVGVFAEDAQAQAAKDAGADVVGGQDLIDEIKSGNINCDVYIAQSSMMARLSALGKVLGPKGLMPNPKLGTVTEDLAKAVKAVKAGQVVVRVDKGGNIHGVLGKISFSSNSLKENFEFFLNEVIKARPESLKGNLIKRAFVTTTMGPSLKLAL